MVHIHIYKEKNMFNVTVLKMKDIIKFILIVLSVIILLFFIVKVASNIFKGDNNIFKAIGESISSFSKDNLIGCLDMSIPAISSIEGNEKTEKEKNKENALLKGILESQITSFKTIEESEYEIAKDNEELNEDNTSDNTEVATNSEETWSEGALPAEVFTNNPIKETYNVQTR